VVTWYQILMILFDLKYCQDNLRSWLDSLSISICSVRNLIRQNPLGKYSDILLSLLLMIKGQLVFHCRWKNNQQGCVDVQCCAICMFHNMLGTLRTINLLTGIFSQRQEDVMLILCVVVVLESNPWCCIWTDCIVFQSSKHIFQGE